MMHVHSVSTSRLSFGKSTGFALIITLIMVVLAAIIVIVFLSSASLDRTTSKSVGDRYQAEIAVQNGLEAAKKALMASPSAANSVIADDTFLVLRADGNQTNSNGTHDAYYFLAKAQAGSANKIDCYPLFSGGTASQVTINLNTNPAVQKPQAPVVAFSNPAQDSSGTKKYPQLLSFQQPAYTQWIELHDPNDSATSAPYTLPYQRYTYWVEDLAGYLDASQVGNEINSGKHQRSNGTNPNELALFTIFDAINPIDLGSTFAKNLIDNRALLFTVPTLQQVAPPPAGQLDVTQPNLAVQLGIDTGGEQNLVPFGYGYPAAVEGKAKTDLNSLISAKNVNGIANAVIAALPNFKNRAGGLPAGTFDYAKNLAANIIDYVDPSNAPTTDSSTYRGIGAFPFLVSTYDLNNWTATNNVNGDYQVTIQVTTYLQLWDPHNLAVNGTAILHYENVDKLSVNGTVVNYTPPPDLIASVSMTANQYKVFVFPIQTYTFDWGPTPPASNASIPFPGTTGNYFTLKWNGKLADRMYKNVQRPFSSVGMKYNGANPNASTKWEWRGNAAPPIYTTVGTSSGGTPGDPRISFYLNRSWTDANYEDNSSWGGRLKLWKAGVELQPSIWPDGGHDSTLGDNPTHSVRPDTSAGKVILTAADANMWVSRLSNRTPPALDTLAELGNVFDPSQWKYSIPSNYPLPPPTVTPAPDLPTSATADSTAGGGYTLCIGRPEFSNFDTNHLQNGVSVGGNGQRAWQLLDIFSLGPPRTVTTGLVNLNTASFESLRALAASIVHNRDAAIKPTTLYPPTANAPTAAEQQPPARTNGGQADLFAEAVVQSRPLLSTAQIQTIKNTLGPFFGNANQWKDQTVPSEWNDSAREELFSKLLNLTTVRSRNFRVFVTGQALDKNGKVLSTVNKVFQVFLKPTRAADGSIPAGAQQTEIRYEAFL